VTWRQLTLDKHHVQLQQLHDHRADIVRRVIIIVIKVRNIVTSGMPRQPVALLAERTWELLHALDHHAGAHRAVDDRFIDRFVG
jgi:hypothetical protein